MITPSALLLDVTRRCNAECRICGRRFWSGKTPPDMDPDLALRLVALPFIDRVCLGQYGEPTLWGPLPAIAAAAAALGRYVWTTTNGALLSGGRARLLLESRIDKVIWSIDSIKPETYKILRPPLSFFEVVRNLDEFLEARARGPYPARVVVNMTRSAENAAEDDEEVRAFWKARGVDGVAITPEADISPHRGTKSGAPITCERPYDHLTVRCDGALMLCCRDCHGAFELGEVGTDPLAAYNGPAFAAIRTALETGTRYPAMCRGCRVFWPDARPPVRGQ